MKQHDELRYTSVAELAHLTQNGGAYSLLKTIYKYVANILGSDPYWFQCQKELTAQADKERLKGTLFGEF